ncbi:hypothetical protein [Chitinophaga arvensicola]|uniref:hypothetical protein n=1 Tax=Chitinophaga arvensicola TaxID=29529 RepID=UPI000B7E6F11|nr:hypothetical protein [Chitinophaga arvensicola]
MKTEDFLSDDFLKQFKTADQLNGFLAQIQKRGIKKMLEGELEAYKLTFPLLRSATSPAV